MKYTELKTSFDINDPEFINAAMGIDNPKADAGFARLQADIANGSAIGIRPMPNGDPGQDVEPEPFGFEKQ